MKRRAELSNHKALQDRIGHDPEIFINQVEKNRHFYVKVSTNGIMHLLPQKLFNNCNVKNNEFYFIILDVNIDELPFASTNYVFNHELFKSGLMKKYHEIFEKNIPFLHINFNQVGNDTVKESADISVCNYNIKLNHNKSNNVVKDCVCLKIKISVELANAIKRFREEFYKLFLEIYTLMDLSLSQISATFRNRLPWLINNYKNYLTEKRFTHEGVLKIFVCMEESNYYNFNWLFLVNEIPEHIIMFLKESGDIQEIEEKKKEIINERFNKEIKFNDVIYEMTMELIS